LSTDGSWEEVAEYFSKNPKVRIVRNKRKLLAAGSRNMGVRLARGKYIALLDHDVEVEKNWIKEALKVFQRHSKVGAVQSVVLDIKKRNIIQHAGIKIQSYLGWVISLGFGTDVRVFDPKEEEVFADATGIIFKKDVWEKIGGFDEDLAINVDDWDFNWRIWIYGYKEYLAPRSITYHWSKKQSTRDRWIKRFWWEFHFAKVPWLFIKNYELGNLAIHLPVYLLVNLFRGVFNLAIRFNASPLLAFFYASGWILVNFGNLIKKRNKTQKNRKLPDRYLLIKLMDNEFIQSYFIKHWLPVVGQGRKISTSEPY
jgi:GT2 family glycosyltransferase